MIGTEAGLSIQNAAMKVQWYGLLLSLHLSPHHPSHLTASTNPTRHVPPIPEAYISLLSAQCFVSLCDGLAGYVIPLYNTLAVQKPPDRSPEPVRAPGPLDLSTLPESEPTCVGLQTSARDG